MSTHIFVIAILTSFIAGVVATILVAKIPFIKRNPALMRLRELRQLRIREIEEAAKQEAFEVKTLAELFQEHRQSNLDNGMSQASVEVQFYEEIDNLKMSWGDSFIVNKALKRIGLPLTLDEKWKKGFN